MSRTDKAIKNFFYALIGQATALLISFVSRSVFLKTLGTEYLGANGLFSNILTILSFAELGVGAAIVYCLYEPLAKKDKEKIKSLMRLYKSAYRWIGLVILGCGIILTPFVQFLIKGEADIQNLNIIFFLFVLNSAVSYFFSYKRSLIIANQNRYIATIYRYTFYFFLNIAQIIFLFLTKNYIIFLILQVVCTLLENICVSKRADKLYPFINELDVKPLDAETKGTIVRNVKAMMIHKSGNVLVSNTDNIIISKILGLATVGLYSNYSLITQALHMVFSMFFQSVTAGVGNIGVTQDRQYSLTVFYRLFFINFIIYGISSIIFINTINPFVELWLGDKFTLDKTVVVTLGINFYITGIRKTVLTFREAFGLYWFDRFKPIAESIINLVASIILAYKFGLAGVFMGTIISAVTTCCWVEPFMLYKHGFKASPKLYFKKLTIYTLLFIVINLIVEVACSFRILSPLSATLVCAMVSLVIPAAIILVLFAKTDELKYFLQLCKRKMLRKK